VPFVAPISSIGSNHGNKNSNSLQASNKISGQSVQAKNVNCNPTDGVFLVFTMLQQIMTELLGTETETKRLLS
jgi:hypothetical protein